MLAGLTFRPAGAT